MAEEREDEIDAIEDEVEEAAAVQAETQMDAKEDAGLQTEDEYGSPTQQSLENVHTFLKRAVFDTPETFKVANLKQAEIGTPQLPIRVWLNLATSFEVRGKYTLADYCRRKASNISDPSLSRDGFALKVAVTTKKEVHRIRRRIPEEDERR